MKGIARKSATTDPKKGKKPQERTKKDVKEQHANLVHRTKNSLSTPASQHNPATGAAAAPTRDEP